MKIAVLIPCYNVEKYLAECLDSVLAAGTATSGLEVFCCDDGSRDGTLEILKGYAAQHPEVHYVTQPNAGVSAARNRLLDELPPEFDAFAFVDADDTVAPDIYVKLAEAMERTRSDLAECLSEGPETVIDDMSVYRLRRTAVGNWVPIFTKLYRRSVLGGVRFRTELAHEEDYLYGYEIHAKAQRKVLIPGYYYLHRNNPDSVCNRLNMRKYVASACTRVRISQCEILASGWLKPSQVDEFRRDLSRDAYRMCIRKNLKKNKNAAERRELFLMAGKAFGELERKGFVPIGLKKIEALLYRCCTHGRHGMARLLSWVG